MVISLEEMGKKARQSAFELAQTPTSLKNAVLNKMADALIEKEEEILTQNRLDLEKASEMPQNFTDRLTLDHDRILGMAEGLRQLHPCLTRLETRMRPGSTMPVCRLLKDGFLLASSA